MVNKDEFGALKAQCEQQFAQLNEKVTAIIKEAVSKAQYSKVVEALHTRIEKLESIDAIKSAKIEELLKRVEQLEATNKLLNGEVNDLKSMSSLDATKSYATTVTSGNGTGAKAVITSIVCSELVEARRVEKNFIIRGLPENSGGDDQAVDELINAIGLDKSIVRKKTRLRRKVSSQSPNSERKTPEPVIVECVNVTARDDVIRRASKLKEHDRFRSVYVGRDRTRAERVADAALRRERDEKNAALEFEFGERRLRYGKRGDGTEFYWAVRSGKVVEVARRKLN